MIRCNHVVALACALYAGSLLGHATLVASDPADGAELARPPAEIVFHFDEAVTPIAVRLLDNSGAHVSLENAVLAAGATIRVKVPAILNPGSYWMSYRVVSSDSHPVAGAMTFSIGPRGTAPAPQAIATLASVDVWPRIAARALQDLALTVCAGVALFVLMIAPLPRERVMLLSSAAVAILASAAGTWAQGSALLGSGESHAVIEAWRVGLAGTQGTSTAFLAAAVLAIAASTFWSLRRGRAILLAAGVALLVASACITGHPATMEPRVLALPAIGIHVLAAAFWAGSIAALAVLVRGPEVDRTIAALQRFSSCAIVAVVALAIAAILLAAIQLGWPPDLFADAYGRLILAKSVLFAALLAVATLNRFRLAPDLARDRPLAGRRLATSLHLEMILITLAVVAAAALSQTSPPHSVSLAHAERVEVLKAPPLAARLSVAPGRAGLNTFTIVFTATDGTPTDPAEVVLEIANPKAGAEAIVRRPLRVASGEYRWTGSELAFPGDWSLAIRARVSDFELVQLDTIVRIE